MSTTSVSGSGVVYTKGSGTAVFVPMTAWMPAVNVLKARATVELRSTTSSNIEVAGGYECATDVEASSFPAGGSIGTYSSTLGFNYGNAWTDLTATTIQYQWIRFGINARNVTGLTYELAFTTFKIDILSP